MYPSNMYPEMRDRRVARLQKKAMHLFFTAATFYLLGLATVCYALSLLTK